jgi:hypothetical protein
VRLVRQRGKRARVKADGDWRRHLEKGDEAELLRWVKQSGLELVARIAAALTDAIGERGQPDMPDTLLLLKMAYLKRQQPNRKLHSIAVEIAREAPLHLYPPYRKKRPPAMKSLVSKLERDFRKHRHKWMMFAETAPEPSRENINQDANRLKSTDEFRARARLVGLLPSKIDLYDALLADAKKLGSDKAKLVKALTRERAEPLLVDAIKRQAHRSL